MVVALLTQVVGWRVFVVSTMVVVAIITRHCNTGGGGHIVTRGGEVAVVVTLSTRRWWGGGCGVVEDGESEDEGLRENFQVSVFACVCIHYYISTLNHKISTLFTTTTTTTC